MDLMADTDDSLVAWTRDAHATSTEGPISGRYGPFALYGLSTLPQITARDIKPLVTRSQA